MPIQLRGAAVLRITVILRVRGNQRATIDAFYRL